MVRRTVALALLVLGMTPFATANAIINEQRLRNLPASGVRDGGIAFTYVPTWGSSDDLRGRVWDVNPVDYRVVVYIFVEHAGGWWVKPTLGQPLTPIAQDGSWSTDIDTGGIDRYATRVIAFLVPAGYGPPLCSPCSELPPDLFTFSYDITCRAMGSRTIQAFGLDWIVKRADHEIGPVGPDTNYFSDRPEHVWADDEGLHLRIAYQDPDWMATEVVADTSLGYGTYAFWIDGAVDVLDANMVLGLFTWDDCAPYAATEPDPAFREMDLEFSRWGDPGSEWNAQFVLQPWQAPGHLHRYGLDLSGQSRSHYRFTWAPDSIRFEAHFASSHHVWTYFGDDIPRPDRENVRMNLWLIAPPAGEEEIVIRRFLFLPPGVTDVDGEPDAAPIVARLLPGRPNPFIGETEVMCDLTVPGHVLLSVHDSAGRRICILVDRTQAPGRLTARWDGRADDGQYSENGIYYLRLASQNAVSVRKITLMK